MYRAAEDHPALIPLAPNIVEARNSPVLSARRSGAEPDKATAVENYPRFPDGLDGPDLIIRMLSLHLD